MLFICLASHVHLYVYAYVYMRMFVSVYSYDRVSVPGRSYPRLIKWYLIPPCLKLSNIRYVSRVK